jgi:hypothetical protein
VQQTGYTIAILKGLILTFQMDVNAMPVKTDSSSVSVANLIYAMAMTLKNLVWRKPLKPILTAKEEESVQVTPLETAIIDKLCKYIDSTITIKQFYDWFVPTTWTIPKEEERASKLVYTIKLRFAEYSNGHWTKEQLRERLIDLIL